MVERETTACGDVFEWTPDALVVRAAFPIPGLEVSKFRAPILVVNGARYSLTSVAGDPKRPTYRLVPEERVTNLYAPAGDAFEYDPERHLERRRARASYWTRFALGVLCIPLVPFIGMLPADVKQRLVVIGIDPGRSTRASLMIEWLIVGLGLIAYPFAGGFFTVPGAFVGAILLLTALDIAHRVTADQQDQHAGMYSIVGEIVRFIREVRSPPRLPDAPPVEPSAAEKLADAQAKITEGPTP